MASEPEATELLKCQTTILKVSIHCEGCKKKVKKVLQGLEGVYAIEINSKQNKVIVTGSVDAQSLIQKLLKHKKHAEIWPEKKSTSDSNTEISKIPSSAPKTEQNLPNTEKEEKTEESKDKSISTSPAEATEAIKSDEVSTSEISNNKPENSDNIDSEKPAEEVGIVSEKKADDLKINKGEKDEIEERAICDSVAPKEFVQPVYTVSYSAVQPSSSYAYYRPSEMVESASFAYQFPSEIPSEISSGISSGGSYDMFNEENPNACNLM